MLLQGAAEDAAYRKMKDVLEFLPSIKERGEPTFFPPFQMSEPYVIFAIEETEDKDDVMDELILAAFCRCVEPGESVYAMDWEHHTFLFDPADPQARDSVLLPGAGFGGEDLWACFPSFYPDGDYSFFFTEDVRMGYLAHPWRSEVWVFGEALIGEFERFYRKLHWKKIPLLGISCPERVRRLPVVEDMI